MAARGNRRHVALDGRHPFPYGRYAFVEIRRQAAVQIRQDTAVSIGSQDVLLEMSVLTSEALPKCWFGGPRIPAERNDGHRHETIAGQHAVQESHPRP